MRQSRYLWILGLSIICVVTIISFQTPQTVISVLAHPNYQNNSRTVIQRFWDLLDSRQTDLAQGLLLLPPGSADAAEFKTWKETLDKDPLLSLQKVEFLNQETTQNSAGAPSIVVRVSWTSPIQNVQTVSYLMGLKATDNGWRIQQFKRLDTHFISS